ncbi:unnamed protein product, partial [Gulo gulo]
PDQSLLSLFKLPERRDSPSLSNTNLTFRGPRSADLLPLPTPQASKLLPALTFWQPIPQLFLRKKKNFFK